MVTEAKDLTDREVRLISGIIKSTKPQEKKVEMDKTYADIPQDDSVNSSFNKINVVTKPTRTKLWDFSDPAYKD